MAKTLDKQAGVSLVEYIIALTLVVIVIVGWLRLTSYGIQNNHFVVQLGEMDTLARGKVHAIIDNLAVIVPHLATQTGSGSLNPGELLPGYSDQLNQSGCLIGADGEPVDCTEVSQLLQTKGHTLSDSRVPRFTRQWLISTNYPDQNNITVTLHIKRLGTNPIVRLSKETKIDGIVSK